MQTRELFISARRSKVRFLWLYNHSQLLHSLSLNIVRETCSYIVDSIERVPGLEGRTVKVYCLSTKSVHTSVVGVRFSVGVVCCILDNDWTLCLGGYPAKVKCHLLSLRDFAVTRLRDMRTPRGWSGVLRCDEFVYVFGGYDSVALSSAEKFNLRTFTWSSLPNTTNPMHAFSPCRFEDDVYLPELCHHTGILELFHLPSDTFKSVTVSFPLHGNNSVSVIHGSELIIITVNLLMTRWTINSQSTCEVFPVRGHDFLGVPSQCPPVKFNNEYYFVEYVSGDLVTFNPEVNSARVRVII